MLTLSNILHIFHKYVKRQQKKKFPTKFFCLNLIQFPHIFFKIKFSMESQPFYLNWMFATKQMHGSPFPKEKSNERFYNWNSNGTKKFPFHTRPSFLKGSWSQSLDPGSKTQFEFEGEMTKTPSLARRHLKEAGHRQGEFSSSLPDINRKHQIFKLLTRG